MKNTEEYMELPTIIKQANEKFSATEIQYINCTKVENEDKIKLAIGDIEATLKVIGGDLDETVVIISSNVKHTVELEQKIGNAVIKRKESVDKDGNVTYVIDNIIFDTSKNVKGDVTGDGYVGVEDAIVVLTKYAWITANVTSQP